jgi:5'(3')-deoxyribonucleotidase
MKTKLLLGFDLDGVVLDSVPTIVQLHHELTGEIPKIHHSQSKSWNFQDIITANTQIVNSYFENERFFELVPFISDNILSMKSLLEELLAEKKYEIHFVTKATEENFRLKKQWVKERLPLFNTDNMERVEFNVEGKPNADFLIFVDDVSMNLKGKSKYNILFRKNGLITEYNEFVPDNVIVVNSVCQLANTIFEILEFEKGVNGKG